MLCLQSVQQKSEKIGEEEVKCQHMADLAQHDLDEALPALQDAMRVSITIFTLSILAFLDQYGTGTVIVHLSTSEINICTIALIFPFIIIPNL